MAAAFSFVCLSRFHKSFFNQPISFKVNRFNLIFLFINAYLTLYSTAVMITKPAHNIPSIMGRINVHADTASLFRL